MDNLGELFELIRARCEPEEVVELADISIDELLLRFRGNVIENRERFEVFLDVYEVGGWDA
jgi:hypothetical protein